jgi:tetratricopeptide (TPR) repeat protein
LDLVTAWIELGKDDEAEKLLAEALSEVSGRSWATALVLEVRALVHSKRSRWSEAIADYSESIRIDPQAYRYRLRGYIYHRSERWKEAAADHRKAIEMEPTNHESYHHLTACLIQSGNVAAYRENCQQIIARFAEASDPIVMERMAKDCSILPNSGVDLAVLNRWTEQAVAAGESHWAIPWFYCARGLVQYRHGRYADAADTMERLLQRWGDSPDSERAVQGWMVLAMARHHLREHEAAVSALARGLELAETALAKPGSGDVGSQWVDWSFARALMLEARTLIEKDGR